MAMSSSISTLSPPIFIGENYHVWLVKMEAYLRGLLLWEAVESDIETEMPKNPTLNQIKLYEERVSRKYRALSSLHVAITRLLSQG